MKIPSSAEPAITVVPMEDRACILLLVRPLLTAFQVESVLLVLLKTPPVGLAAYTLKRKKESEKN